MGHIALFWISDVRPGFAAATTGDAGGSLFAVSTR